MMTIRDRADDPRTLSEVCSDPEQRELAIHELEAARDLIADPVHWGKGTAHQVAGGVDKWCARGAVGAVHKFAHYGFVTSTLDEIARHEFGFCCTTCFNDNKDTDHETVMLMFKTAINDLESS